MTSQETDHLVRPDDDVESDRVIFASLTLDGFIDKMRKIEKKG